MNNIKRIIERFDDGTTPRAKPPGAPRARYAEMDWTDDGAVCLTNIAGMKCPRCGTPLGIDIEHKCGGALRPLKKRMADKKGKGKEMKEVKGMTK